MPIVEVRPIPVEATYAIRQQVLWPDDPPEAIHRLGDSAVGTLHVGGFWEEQMVSIATVIRDAPPETQHSTAWRLRAVATLPEFQGRGIGKAVISHCIEYAIQQGGTLLWCNARPDAVGFYEKLGFQIEGDLHAGLGHGPRYFMWRSLVAG
ncbi:MAG: putative N-acetyltransferase YitI [Chloroflexota bacterium]|nr:GNAT family N-acetyltransferase [Chloroflexota bacterium]NOG64634.1 GNAT family N-acetyltransferase [Chloroflexota bacterium]GIK63365.1 MAG: putative N-acetyltransferase YitI [Chloroflexota bacterium]